MSISKNSLSHYFSEPGNYCPRCASHVIEGNTTTCEGSALFQTMACGNCSLTWNETWRLQEINGQSVDPQVTGDNCPSCASDNIDGEWPQHDDNQFTRLNSCNDCDSEWEERFSLESLSEFIDNNTETERTIVNDALPELLKLQKFMHGCDITQVGILTTPNERISELYYDEEKAPDDSQNIRSFSRNFNGLLRSYMDKSLLSTQVKAPAGKKKQNIADFVSTLPDESPYLRAVNEFVNMPVVLRAMNVLNMANNTLSCCHLDVVIAFATDISNAD